MHSTALLEQVGIGELSYADAVENALGRKFVELIERLSGRARYEALYELWRRDIARSSDRVFGRMLELVDIGLTIEGALPRVGDRPLVMVANHPFGIADGAAALSIAEQLGRPFRVLINAELLRVPEVRPYSLPINFHDTKEAQRNNLAVRREALELIRAGVTIVVFPSGGVATAPSGFGAAHDLPWKLFPARLIQDAKADVLPVHFAGQNERIFHLASRFSTTLRLSLLVQQFTRMAGRTVEARVGSPVPWHDLEGIRDRKALTAHLRQAVFALSRDGDPAASATA